MNVEPYPTPAGVEAAIKSAAQKAMKANPSRNIGDLIQQAYFDRFLTRLFTADEGWMLKGGASLLARVPTARSTTDLDLFLSGRALNDALAELRTAAARDLGDWFRFEYATHRPTIAGEQQPYAEGYRVTFDVYIGAASRGKLNVDLVVKNTTTAPPEIQLPANVLDLPRLPSAPYRLYPLVDQIADKVCATLEGHNGKPSSREKDLVDLALIAITYDIDGDQLRTAVVAEATMRKLELPSSFKIPAQWGRIFSAKAKTIPTIRGYSVGDAQELVAELLDPILGTNVQGMIWRNDRSTWEHRQP
ncbi:MAG: nucleotidyl transferase AbiEii/AbiGii toxin family protein [Propionibacteriaceae bacterium]